MEIQRIIDIEMRNIIVGKKVNWRLWKADSNYAAEEGVDEVLNDDNYIVWTFRNNQN